MLNVAIYGAQKLALVLNSLPDIFISKTYSIQIFDSKILLGHFTTGIITLLGSDILLNNTTSKMKWCSLFTCKKW